MSATVAVIGEAVIDFGQVGGEPLTFRGKPGGSPLNVAVAAARQGQPSTVLTQFSTDLFGNALIAHLHNNGVDTSLSGRSGDPTALAFVSQDSAGNAHFQFVANGSADKRWDPRPRPALPDTVRFVQLSSLTLFDEPSHTTALDLITSCADRASVLFDPTYRPALIPSVGAFLAVLDLVLPHASIIKPSDQDLGFLYPGRDPRDVCREWVDRGVAVVILTLGENGAVVFRAGADPIAVGAPAVQLVDTVGAGDTFTGTLFARLIEAGAGEPSALARVADDAWADALRWANTAAAINCTRAGCDPPTRDEVARALN